MADMIRRKPAGRQARGGTIAGRGVPRGGAAGPASLRRALKGAYDGPLPRGPELTPVVVAALSALAETVKTQAAALAQTAGRLAELESLADRDPLLGILNRRAFERELRRMAAFVERYGGKASVVFIDLNKFKWINDVYGHKAGDDVLRHVAALIEANVRSSDLVARLGGDEFGILLAQADGAAAAAKAEQLEAVLATTPVGIEGTAVLLSASAGSAEIGRTAEVAAKLEEADAEMFRSKAVWHAGDQRGR
jgi:diguanylate cyclase (GGDEF)-like protein